MIALILTEHVPAFKVCSHNDINYDWIYFSPTFAYEPEHDKIHKKTLVHSKDSDQPGHPPSLIIFAVCFIGSYGPKSYWSWQQRMIYLPWQCSSFLPLADKRLWKKWENEHEPVHGGYGKPKHDKVSSCWNFTYSNQISFSCITDKNFCEHDWG